VKWTVLWMIIDTYCLVFTLRLSVRLTEINFLIARLIAIKNFNHTAALVTTFKSSYAHHWLQYNHQRACRPTYTYTIYSSLFTVKVTEEIAITTGGQSNLTLAVSNPPLAWYVSCVTGVFTPNRTPILAAVFADGRCVALTLTILEGAVDGTRHQGAPCMSWIHNVLKWSGKTYVKLEAWHKIEKMEEVVVGVLS